MSLFKKKSTPANNTSEATQKLQEKNALDRQQLTRDQGTHSAQNLIATINELISSLRNFDITEADVEWITLDLKKMQDQLAQMHAEVDVTDLDTTIHNAVSRFVRVTIKMLERDMWVELLNKISNAIMMRTRQVDDVWRAMIELSVCMLQIDNLAKRLEAKEIEQSADALRAEFNALQKSDPNYKRRYSSLMHDIVAKDDALEALMQAIHNNDVTISSMETTRSMSSVTQDAMTRQQRELNIRLMKSSSEIIKKFTDQIIDETKQMDEVFDRDIAMHNRMVAQRTEIDYSIPLEYINYAESMKTQTEKAEQKAQDTQTEQYTDTAEDIVDSTDVNIV